MATKKRRKPLFERLKQGLEEAIAWSKAELTLRTIKTGGGATSVVREETHRPPATGECETNK